MKNPGQITVNDAVVGIFELDDDERVTFRFDKGAGGLLETLEFASEQGLHVGLRLMPDFPLDEEEPVNVNDVKRPLGNCEG